MMVVLGGIGTLWGGVLGAGAGRPARGLAVARPGSRRSAWSPAAIFVVIVLVFRRGIWGSVAALAHRLAARRR